MVFSTILLWSDFRMRIISGLEREISYKRAHSFLQVYVFNHSKFVKEANKWKGVIF